MYRISLPRRILCLGVGCFLRKFNTQLPFRTRPESCQKWCQHSDHRKQQCKHEQETSSCWSPLCQKPSNTVSSKGTLCWLWCYWLVRMDYLPKWIQCILLQRILSLPLGRKSKCNKPRYSAVHSPYPETVSRCQHALLCTKWIEVPQSALLWWQRECGP